MFIPIEINENLLASDSFFARIKNTERYLDVSREEDVINLLRRNNIEITKDADFLTPKKMEPVCSNNYKKLARYWFSGFDEAYIFRNMRYKQKFIKFGRKKKSSSYDLVIHARNREGVRPEDNWDISNWNKVVSYFKDANKDFKIASIGSSGSSFHVPNTDNFLDLELSKVCDIISSSKVIAGPLSGPIHLSALCGTPQVVWSEKNNNEIRCVTKWNPFETDVSFIRQRNPDFELVCKNIQKYTA